MRRLRSWRCAVCRARFLTKAGYLRHRKNMKADELEEWQRFYAVLKEWTS